MYNDNIYFCCALLGLLAPGLTTLTAGLLGQDKYFDDFFEEDVESIGYKTFRQWLYPNFIGHEVNSEGSDVISAVDDDDTVVQEVSCRQLVLRDGTVRGISMRNADFTNLKRFAARLCDKLHCSIVLYNYSEANKMVAHRWFVSELEKEEYRDLRDAHKRKALALAIRLVFIPTSTDVLAEKLMSSHPVVERMRDAKRPFYGWSGRHWWNLWLGSKTHGQRPAEA